MKMVFIIAISAAILYIGITAYTQASQVAVNHANELNAAFEILSQ